VDTDRDLFPDDVVTPPDSGNAAVSVGRSRAAVNAAIAHTSALLTNAMLLRGRRLDMLRQMDRDRLVLQISLDSPTPDLHDRHRGARSWERAVAGIRTAQSCPVEDLFRCDQAVTVGRGEVSSTIRRCGRRESAAQRRRVPPRRRDGPRWP
jgi:hypothetical protein